MTEPQPAPTPRDTAPVDDDAVVEAEIVEEPAHTSATEPVVATPVPDAVVTEAAPVAPQQRVVYVTAPPAPRKAGNRGFGALLAVASAVVYLVLLAVVFALVSLPYGGFSFNFLAAPTFYIPVLFFVIGAVLLALIVNRGGWPAHVLGSLLVGVLVYFGTTGLVLLTQGVIMMTPDAAASAFRAGLSNPFVIASGLLAREVSLWTGAIIARRGRTLKARNTEAREAWQREVDEQRAKAERGL
ncbi:MAG TPA: hypothetical protein VN200_08160 [Rhodoglobus sp.]|nr:hypothetical protein [Rhodoglobus sp.]